MLPIVFLPLLPTCTFAHIYISHSQANPEKAVFRINLFSLHPLAHIHTNPLLQQKAVSFLGIPYP